MLMLHPNCVYMLAADHRWQWEEWCDARSIARERIPEVKRIAFDGFMRARDQSADVRTHGALLIDEQYAGPVVAEALRAGVTVGTPVERPGAFPLAWSTTPFERAITGEFAKVLVRHRPDDAEAIREAQFEKLKALQAWCRRAGKPLVLEILVARRQEPEDEFEASGRPRMLAAFIAAAYSRSLVPEFWKIEGTVSQDGARIIDDAIAARPEGRQIILGKGADTQTIDRWFAAAAGSKSAVGFAIGRSVVWEPATAYLTGSATSQQAAAAIASNYLRLVDAWRAAAARSG
jgi:myo-inositol catabolism protein IolC